MKKPVKVNLQNNTKLIAHRGLSGVAPENSIEAFNLCGLYGYYGIECDIHVTKDHQFVVFHDSSLDRMTNTKGMIKDLTVSEIKEIDIVSGSGIDKYDFVKIPLLTEYLDVCLKHNLTPIIEIKAVGNLADLDSLIDLLKTTKLFIKAIIISFNLDYLIYLRKYYPTLNIQYLVNEVNDEVITICINYQMDIDINGYNISEEIIKKCHEYGILVNVFTIDIPEYASLLSDLKVDFITTNILYN